MDAEGGGTGAGQAAQPVRDGLPRLQGTERNGIPLHSRARGAEGPHWHTANKKGRPYGQPLPGYTTRLQGNLNFEVQRSQFLNIIF